VIGIISQKSHIHYGAALSYLFFTVCTVLFALCAVAEPQQSAKTPRIGYLSSGGRKSANAEGFRQGLRELGYVEEQNIVIEYQWADGHSDRLPALATELVRRKVDIIFTQGVLAASAAKKATSTIPIIFVGATDPVAIGIVGSLARPGGNVTGFTTGAPGLYGKKLELLKETIPQFSRVGVLRNPDPSADPLKEIRFAAQYMGVHVQSLDVRSPEDIDSAFERATSAHADGLVVAQAAPMTTHLKQVAELAAKHRLPAIYNTDTEWIPLGGLMSYGPSVPDLHRRAAVYVDKILKGTKPADLPVERPTKFELVINLKTAKQIGLIIPPNVLARADRVIR
jgi:ABC-type uncharacterized transport system substrate-binding protein